MNDHTPEVPLFMRKLSGSAPSVNKTDLTPLAVASMIKECDELIAKLETWKAKAEPTPPVTQPATVTPKRWTFTLAEIEEAAEDSCGFCLACGAINSCCEPDARRYPCESCEAKRVYGTDELAMMGRIV